MQTQMSSMKFTDKNEFRLLFVMTLTRIFSICKNIYVIKAIANMSMIYET